MNERMSYYIIILLGSTVFLYFFALVIKYYYISAICREWNKKLYQYHKHVSSQKDSEKNRKDYSYLEEMYLYPDEIGILVFKDWSESDLIVDKITLFNVNQYNKHEALIKVESYD